MLSLDRVRWCNLLSTGNDWMEIDLAGARTTLMVGENGAGKSTVLDALSLGLFNKPFRNINRPDLVNSVTNKGLLVEVFFRTPAHSYVVRRGIKPNVFEILRDGALIPPPADLRDYQEMLETHVLRFGHRVGMQVVMLGSRYVQFMQLPAQHRREIVEELLDIRVFSTMNTLLKERVAANKAAMTAADADLLAVEGQLEVNRRHVESLRQDNEALVQQREAQAEAEQQALNALAAEAMTRHEESQALRAGLDDAEAAVKRQLETSTAALARLRWQHDTMTSELAFFEQHADCPTCKQSIDPAFRNQKASELRARCEEAFADAATHAAVVEEAKAATAAHGATRAAVARIDAELGRMSASAREKQRYLTQLRDEAHLLRKRSEVIATGDDMTAELTARRDAATARRDALLREAAVVEAAAALLKDGGIKARVVKQYLPVLNAFIAKYLAAFDFFVDFRLDENFGEVILSRYRDKFSYESFSEGEKCRINLALLFAWRAVARMRNSVHCNFLILDEILDGSLDAGGAEDFIKIMGALTTDETNVFVISHRGDQLTDKFDRTLSFEKVKNFTTMEVAA